MSIPLIGMIMCDAGKANVLIHNKSSVGRKQLNGYRWSQWILFGQYDPTVINTMVKRIVVHSTNVMTCKCEMPHIPLMLTNWTDPDM